MLNKPKFMSPSINMYGNTVIDLNSDTLPFSCVIDGNEAITDFRIVVSSLKDNVVVFDTGIQTLEKPFFPINNRNQNVVFSIDLKKYFDTAIVKSDDFKNRAQAFYWAITFKNNVSNTETYSAAEVFYANSTPEVSVYYSYDQNATVSVEKMSELTEDISLEKRKVFLKATYVQKEGVPLKRYGWRLTDKTNDVVIFDTISKNQIYGVAEDISCVCNGLINQTSYLAELYIETQNGCFNILKSIPFAVNYVVKNMEADFEIVALNDTAGIMLNWGNMRTTEGVVVGDTVSYAENFPVQSSASIVIPEGTSVVFAGTSSGKDLEIDENSYVVLSFQIEKLKNMTLFEMYGEDEMSNAITRKLESVSFGAATMLQYTIQKGDTVVSKRKTLTRMAGEISWCIVTLYPLIDGTADFKLVRSTAQNGVFPSEDLYPDKDLLYPYYGEWEIENEVY